jgi:hypothetical protein
MRVGSLNAMAVWPCLPSQQGPSFILAEDAANAARAGRQHPRGGAAAGVLRHHHPHPEHVSLCVPRHQQPACQFNKQNRVANTRLDAQSCTTSSVYRSTCALRSRCPGSHALLELADAWAGANSRVPQILGADEASTAQQQPRLESPTASGDHEASGAASRSAGVDDENALSPSRGSLSAKSDLDAPAVQAARPAQWTLDSGRNLALGDSLLPLDMQLEPQLGPDGEIEDTLPAAWTMTGGEFARTETDRKFGGDRDADSDSLL